MTETGLIIVSYFDVEINYCQSNPCGNNGNCINQPTGYRCNCNLGYTGLNCNTGIN